MKLDKPSLTFDSKSLWAHDIAGRAQSFKQTVAGGMESDKAALSGLLVQG